MFSQDGEHIASNKLRDTWQVSVNYMTFLQTDYCWRQ
jgi:hypothetical protein